MSVFPDNDSLILPDDLARTYEIRSCLKYTEQTRIYLLREKTSGQLYLMKTADDPVYASMLVNEKNMLEHIHMLSGCSSARTFSVPVHLAVHSNTTYYVRTYIPGKTLEDLCESGYRRPGIRLSQALDYVIDLTGLLRFMHHLAPPLIHRDVKPQNVIVDPEGVCHFIDFGISQFYQADMPDDITPMGTKMTAPPEQFCCYPTDMRSDLYSLGILLYYCITGEYKLQDFILDELPGPLRQIIRKATRLHPDERYQSTEELLPDLLEARTYTPC